MPDALDLVITGVGAVTPVGLHAPATCAALRAGIMRLGEISAHLVDGEQFDQKPVLGGRVPTEWFESGPTEEDWPGHARFGVPPPPPPEKSIPSGAARLSQIGIPAALEAWTTSGAKDWIQQERKVRIGFYAGMAESDDDSSARSIGQSLGIAPGNLLVESAGRAAAFAALRRAGKDLLSDAIDVALVGGIDSQIRPERLAFLDEAGVLRSAQRPHGLLPGEAAAFVVVERVSRPRPGRSELARVASVALAHEPTAGTKDPNQAKALTEVLRKMREGKPGLASRALAICDLNGDRLRAIEWAMASLRAFGDLPGDQEIWHPADCIGDSGAAAGALSLAWAASVLARDEAGSAAVVAWGAADGPLRAAAMLTRMHSDSPARGTPARRRPEESSWA